MRSLVLSFVLLLASPCFAEINSLLPGDLSVAPITGDIQFTAPQPLKCDGAFACPTVMENAFVEIQFTLPGCLDRLLSYSKIVENQDQSVDVVVTALNVATKGSQEVRCAAPNIQTMTIDVGYKMADEVRVHFTNNN